MRIFFPIFLLIFSLETFGQGRKKVSENKLANKITKHNSTIRKEYYQYFIIKAQNNTFGYYIFVNGNLLIEQKFIPCLEGNVGFKDTIDAGRTARLVIKKLKTNENPPIVTLQELKKIGIVTFPSPTNERTPKP